MRREKSSFAVALGISALVTILVLVLRGTGNLEFLELAAYDWSLQLLPKASGVNLRIVFVTINAEDIRNLGAWPITDATLAKALTILTQDRALAVGVDIYRDIPVPPGREEFDAILIGNPTIICVTKFGAGGVPPPAVLAGTEQAGFNDMLVDPGGIVRRGLLFLDDGKSVFFSFGLRLAMLYLQAQGISPQPDEHHPEYIRFGQSTIRPLEANDGGYVGADARGYQFLIDFKDQPGSFASYSLTHLLEGKVDPEAVRGKIVLIGVTTQDVKDFFYTPYSRSMQADDQVSGLVMHSHNISQLIRLGLNESRPIDTVNARYRWPWLLFWSLTGGAVGLWVRSAWRFSLAVSCSLLSLCLIGYGAFRLGWWIPVVPPMVGMLGSLILTTAYMSNSEKRQRAALMQIFSRHVSKEVAMNIWNERDKFLDGGRPRSQLLTATILFSDLKGFTPVAEKMAPLELIDWINEYMEIMATLVETHGGVVDDYAGDGIKTNFGVPVAKTCEEEIGRDVANALRCALAMAEAMGRLNTLWQEKKCPAVGLRIGIHTGVVVAGTVGCTQRLKYTTVGNAVNIASRLESYDKDTFELCVTTNPCRILVSDTTLRHAGDTFEAQCIGNAKLKGQEKGLTIYRVLGEKVAGPGKEPKEETS